MEGPGQRKQSLLTRLVQRLSLSKKKKHGKEVVGEQEEKLTEVSQLEAEEVKVSVSPAEVEEENSPPKITVTPARPSPGGLPPLPRGPPRLPSSATTSHSRPVADLDSALRQFKLSTAASRENLKKLGSTQNLSLLERVAQRPPLARPGEGRSRAEEGGTLGRARVRQPSLSAMEGREGLESEWRQLSSSMTCLRARPGGSEV